jgi:hypothetical protein
LEIIELLRSEKSIISSFHICDCEIAILDLRNFERLILWRLDIQVVANLDQFKGLRERRGREAVFTASFPFRGSFILNWLREEFPERPSFEVQLFSEDSTEALPGMPNRQTYQSL